MKHMLLCYTSPEANSYIGGIMSIMNSYLHHGDLFQQNEIEIDLFDYHIKGMVKKLPQKIVNLIYIPLQRIALSRYLNKHEVDIVSIHTSREFLFLKDVSLAKYISKHYNIPVYLTIHVGDISTVFNRISYWQGLLINNLNRYVERVIFLSNIIKDQFISIGLYPLKTCVLYNFCDFDGYLFSKKQTSNKLNLLYIGAIHREKGIIELLHTIERLKQLDYNIHLDVCGKITDYSIENEFKRILDQLSDTISFHGYVKGQTKATIYEHADVLVLPSYHEGMPLVILEALGAGCGIISTKVGTSPEILNNNNVLWIDIKDENQLCKAITTLYGDRDFLAKMQHDNLSKSNEFTIDKHIANYCRILTSHTDE